MIFNLGNVKGDKGDPGYITYTSGTSTDAKVGYRHIGRLNVSNESLDNFTGILNLFSQTATDGNQNDSSILGTLYISISQDLSSANSYFCNINFIGQLGKGIALYWGQNGGNTQTNKGGIDANTTSIDLWAVKKCVDRSTDNTSLNPITVDIASSSIGDKDIQAINGLVNLPPSLVHIPFIQIPNQQGVDIDTSVTIAGNQLQYYIDNLPLILNANVTINVASSNTGDLNINGFIGKGAILINNAQSDYQNFQLCNNLTCDSNIAEVQINGGYNGTSTQIPNNMIQGQINSINSSFVEIMNANMTNSNSTQYIGVSAGNFILSGTGSIHHKVRIAYGGKFTLDGPALTNGSSDSNSPTVDIRPGGIFFQNGSVNGVVTRRTGGQQIN